MVMFTKEIDLGVMIASDENEVEVGEFQAEGTEYAKPLQQTTVTSILASSASKGFWKQWQNFWHHQGAGPCCQLFHIKGNTGTPGSLASAKDKEDHGKRSMEIHPYPLLHFTISPLLLALATSGGKKNQSLL